MKIQVVRCDGNTETLDLAGEVLAIKAAPEGQAELRIKETGITHFFRTEDGAYDGWGMDVFDDDGKLCLEDIAKLVEAIEKDRDIHQTGKVA